MFVLASLNNMSACICVYVYVFMFVLSSLNSIASGVLHKIGLPSIGRQEFGAGRLVLWGGRWAVLFCGAVGAGVGLAGRAL